MVTINPDWDTILNPVPSTSTAYGGTWAMLISKLFNGLDIELEDPSKIPLIGTSFYYKSNRLRILDTEGSHYLKFVLDNIDTGGDKTLRIREFTAGDEDYLVTENEPTELFSKTIDTATNTITGLTNSSFANNAGLAWTKINTTGSKLQDMKNINTVSLLDGQVLQYNASMDTWLPLTPPTTSSNTGIVGGYVTRSGTGAVTTFTIPHGMSTTPTTISVEPASAAANANPFTRTVDATNITITYTVAPANGTNNLAYFWMASDASSTAGSMVYTGQANTFGAFAQTFPSGNLRISNGGFFGSMQSTLTASRLWTFPDGAGTVLLDTVTQTMTGKTIHPTNNTITSTAVGDILVGNGTKMLIKGRGTANQSLVVNAAGTDLEWANRQKPLTISNLGIDGEPVLKQVTTGSVLEAYRIDAASDKILVQLDLNDQKIKIDVDEQWLTLVNMKGNLPYARLSLTNSIVNADIAAHTSTKITITEKAQLNPNIVYKDANTTLGDNDYYFHDNRLYIRNPVGDYSYQFIAAAITGNRTINLPILPAGTNTLAFLEAEQTFINKTLTAPKIQTIINGTGTVTLPVNVNTTLVGRNTTETLTNKTLTAPKIDTIINGTATITLPTVSGTLLTTTSLALDTIGAGTDILTNNATTLSHGLFMKLSTTPFQVPRINAAGTDMEWASLNSEKVAMSTASGNGAATIFNIPHGLGVNPTYAFIQCSSHSIPFTWTKDATNIIVTFTSAPATGTSNVIFYWNAVQ